MFDLNWSDPNVRWLVITNWTLFAVTIICIGVVAYGAGIEISKRFRRRSGAVDEHVAMVPGLGYTMADGGEKAGKRQK